MAQKETVIALVFGVFMALVMNASVAQAAPSAFSTKSECDAATISGAYEAYVPRDFRNHSKNPVDGVTRVAASSEFVSCVLMDTTRGKKYVVQEPGVLFRHRVAEDGSLIQPPYARHDCGNRIYDISFPQEEQSVAPAREERKAPVATNPVQVAGGVAREPLRDACSELGLLGENFVNKVDERGRMYCEEEVPWYKRGAIQYPVNTIVGGTVGYLKADVVGALVGGFSGATGTYLGREIAGEGNEEWGWVGLGTGVLGGSLMHKSGGGSSNGGGSGGGTYEGGPSGGGSGI